MTPWNGGTLWTFETWSIIMKVIPKFLLLDSEIAESNFLQVLEPLRQFPEVSSWKLEVIVATLYAVREALGFGPFWDETH